jgi:amidase/aspartyl-tRNA(Asn)/glutamyl-tRNA(Gln) amidotransferase subunit A
MELMEHSAIDLAAKIRARELSPVEVVDAALDAIDKRDAPINSMVFVAHEEARESAKKAEEAVTRGDALGPLHGVPTALKDLFDFKPGWPTTFGGVPAMKDYIADKSCAWCSHVEAAGAIVIGKTNSAFMGASGITDNPLFGPTRNPFDLSRTAGGSSGGASAVVAEGMLPFSESTDMGGSSRQPAAWTNSVGFKPTFGFTSYVNRPNAFIGVSAYPLEGVAARSVDDIALALGVLIGPQARDPQNVGILARYIDEPEASLKGLRIAYSPKLDVFAVEDDVAAVVADAVRSLEEAGAEVDLVTVGITRDQFELSEAMTVLGAPMTMDGMAMFKEWGVDLMGEHRADLPEFFIEGVEHAANVTVADLSAAQRIRTEVFDAVEDTFSKYDLIVTPTVGCVPINLAESSHTDGPSHVDGVKVNKNFGCSLTYPFNMTGHPAASFPAGFTAEGLPVGMQVIGKRFHDAQVVTAGRALEKVRPWVDGYKRLVSAAR